MKKQASRSTPSAAPPTTTRPSPQTALGNQDLLAELEAPESESETAVLDAFETQSSEAPVKQAKKGSSASSRKKKTATGQAEGAEKAADPISRPKSVRKGATGALIGSGEIVLKTAAGSDRAVATIPSGTPCKVLETAAGDIRVKVRVGKESKEGWVSSSLYSDQPALAKDEDDESLMDDYEYKLFEGDLSPQGPVSGTDTAQGALGDCFFIASLAAVAAANPEHAKTMIRYDAKAKRYIVRFYEEVGRGRFEPVEIEVDGCLPTVKGDATDPAYAGDPGAPLWGALVEKAYAKWKGGYHVLGEGGTGDQAMAEMTGVASKSKDPASMTTKEVLPYFKSAKADNLAIYAGVVNDVKAARQTPLSGSGSGPYSGTLTQSHAWNDVSPGSVSITDKGRKVAEAWDTGQEDDKSAKLEGDDVKSGEVDFKKSRIDVEYASGKAPKSGGDLQVDFSAHGVVLPAKMLIGNHAYAFQDVVDGNKLQFYNPWGAHQPKPITASEFLKFFDSLSTNAVPAQKTTS